MWIDSIAGVMIQNLWTCHSLRDSVHKHILRCTQERLYIFRFCVEGKYIWTVQETVMKLPGFISPHVAFRFAAWIQDIMLIYHRMPILFLFENKSHPPICTRMSCSFLKVGAKASDNLTAVEVGSFSSKVLTTFVGPCPTRIWRWLVICRWERWAFLLLVIVTTLKDFFGRYFK